MSLYQNADNKWCRVCPGCNKEVAYKSKDHAIVAVNRQTVCRACWAKQRREATGQDWYIVPCESPVRYAGSSVVYYRRNFYLPYRGGYAVAGVNDRIFASEQDAQRFIEEATKDVYAPITSIKPPFSTL